MECPDQHAREVVQSWARLWSTGDLSSADGVFASDLIDHRPPPSHDIRGTAQEKAFISQVRSAFPDLHVQIEDLVIDGDCVAARVMHLGTHHGEFLGIAPTGRSVAYEGTVIFRIVEGKISERWGTVDLFAILWQLGEPTLLPLAAGLGAVTST
jgi:steroid delta-isomerase-like uncharacterized protein